MPWPKLWSASADRDGALCHVAHSKSSGFLSALFSALLALALFDHGAATAQEVKQIKLTEKHIQGFMAAYDDIAKLYYENPWRTIKSGAERVSQKRERPTQGAGSFDPETLVILEPPLMKRG
jgi:hypothetical protein